MAPVHPKQLPRGQAFWLPPYRLFAVSRHESPAPAAALRVHITEIAIRRAALAPGCWPKAWRPSQRGREDRGVGSKTSATIKWPGAARVRLSPIRTAAARWSAPQMSPRSAQVRLRELSAGVRQVFTKRSGARRGDRADVLAAWGWGWKSAAASSCSTPILYQLAAAGLAGVDVMAQTIPGSTATARRSVRGGAPTERWCPWPRRAGLGCAVAAARLECDRRPWSADHGGVDSTSVCACRRGERRSSLTARPGPAGRRRRLGRGQGRLGTVEHTSFPQRDAAGVTRVRPLTTVTSRAAPHRSRARLTIAGGRG